MKHTGLSLLHNLVFTGRRKNFDIYFGREVIDISELDMEKTDYIIISSCRFQDEIEQEIRDRCYGGKIVKFYQPETDIEFFRLPQKNSANVYMQGNYKTWTEAKSVLTGGVC